ncbi:hypothetical protein SAMN05660649_05133 [Desulfotomaculum arcticum]|uniref:Uncharacterized protein n=1 Tax=Desulfotruncus arcticus DSM 17038 TaxID=1121424 RepID=A0A1I2ZVF6_9FIRM|nr:hypothetical protein [Desulfotruncus arcticus]SFH41837.1 hypothetical protein SAMN05660649_05133 [Desulfotomaculum arcticum] [Desulfotruncus arcticus DSM 17038]
MSDEFKKVENLIDKALEEVKNNVIYKDNNLVSSYIKYNAGEKESIFNIDYRDGKLWAFFPLEIAFELESKLKNTDFCVVTDPSKYHSGNATAYYEGENYQTIKQIVEAMIIYVTSERFKEHKAKRKS